VGFPVPQSTEYIVNIIVVTGIDWCRIEGVIGMMVTTEVVHAPKESGVVDEIFHLFFERV
jgi:hypothetical protein